MGQTTPQTKQESGSLGNFPLFNCSGNGGELNLYNSTTTPSTLNTPLSLTTTSAAALKFSTAIQNRKIVLYDIGSNDHQYYGLGVNSGVFR